MIKIKLVQYKILNNERLLGAKYLHHCIKLLGTNAVIFRTIIYRVAEQKFIKAH